MHDRPSGLAPPRRPNGLLRSAMRLPPPAYERLQRYAHGGYSDVVDVMAAQLDLTPGDVVVEVGCGTGSLAPAFLSRGFDYWGVEPDAGRVHAARARIGDRFLVGDTTTLRDLALPHPLHFFMHGVLHHMNDRAARAALSTLVALSGHDVIVSEPLRPNQWWTNPLGELVTRFDEGRWPRRQEEWLDLAGRDSIRYVGVRRLWPRWPVAMLDLRVGAS